MIYPFLFFSSERPVGRGRKQELAKKKKKWCASRAGKQLQTVNWWKDSEAQSDKKSIEKKPKKWMKKLKKKFFLFFFFKKLGDPTESEQAASKSSFM